MAKRPKRFILDPALEPFFLGVDDFCRKHLPSEDSEPPRSSAHKIIADPVEGYSSIDSWEISIVDTPLFQRLRGIRQLGLAYLVYPTLGYSRFEHVVGVRARLDQVVATLRQNQLLRGHEGNLPSAKQLTRMRLAVLCHDIGHCLFSHVSESAIEALPGHERYPSGESIASAFETWAGRRIPMGEVFSVAILTSPPFIDYLDRIGMPEIGRHEAAQRIADDAAHLILGVPIPGDPTSLFLAQLMNCGLDIDKLDYMLREALLSGISLGISLEWLMKKLFIASLPGNQLPPGLLNRVRGFGPDHQFSVLALERGGQFAFEEFCVARLALHEKIYLHQKIRAAEVQTKTILHEMARTIPSYDEAHRWLYLQESVLQCSDADLPQVPRTLYDDGRPRRASDFAWHRIRDRQLLSRGYAFGWQNSLADPLTREARDYGVDALMTMVRKEPERFTIAIRQQLLQIFTLLSVEGIDPLKVEILVDPPRLSSIQQGHDTLYFEYPPRLSFRWTMPIDRIVEYYHRNRALGYVFTSREHIPYVLLAAEKAAWELCGVVCAQEDLIDRQSAEQCKALRADLHTKGFYRGSPPLRPMTDYLASVEAQLIVTKIAEKLAAYEARNRKRVSPTSVTTFIGQFPSDLQEAVLSWLQYLDFVRPEVELTSLIPRIVNEELPPSCKSVGISPLGATTDSAFHLAYDLREPLRGKLNPNIRNAQVPLAEALSMKLDAYLIFDDNTNSGLQALNIMAGWLDVRLPSDLQLKEEHVQPLSRDLQAELRAKPLVFAFSVATEGALSALRDQLVAACKIDSNLVTCRSDKELLSVDKIFSGPDSPFQHSKKVALRLFLTNVAKTIFILEGKSENNAESRSLGGKGAEAMIVFPYNCPTMTIPALWLAGTYGGEPWIPLVERGRRTSPTTGNLSGEDAEYGNF